MRKLIICICLLMQGLNMATGKKHRAKRDLLKPVAARCKPQTSRLTPQTILLHANIYMIYLITKIFFTLKINKSGEILLLM